MLLMSKIVVLGIAELLSNEKCAHNLILDVVFRQISTFLEDSVAIVYGLRGL